MGTVFLISMRMDGVVRGDRIRAAACIWTLAALGTVISCEFVGSDYDRDGGFDDMRHAGCSQ